MFLLPKKIWKVKRTKEKGLGVFAREEIQKGNIIGDYLGKVIKTRYYNFSRDKKELYLMYYSDQASIYPDLEKPGIHLINHSCAPNCWIYIYRGHTLFFAFKNIKPHEELTISYLLSPIGKCNPCIHICKCGSKNCTKSMHLSEKSYEKWQNFQENGANKTKRLRVVYGKNLPKIRSYPKILASDPIYEAISEILY
jgi:uncharacterized protein